MPAKIVKTGADVVRILRDEFDCNNNNQLAEALDENAAQIWAWENGSLTQTKLKNILRKLRTISVKNSIRALAEFRELNHDHDHKIDNLRRRMDDEKLVNILHETKGIFSFYDSDGKIIYVGKTEKKTLMNEMTQAYNLARPNYRRKLADKNGKFTVRKLSINDTAQFFSAYEVDGAVIGNIEALITRMIPNNIVNKKTEKFKTGRG